MRPFAALLASTMLTVTLAGRDGAEAAWTADDRAVARSKAHYALSVAGFSLGLFQSLKGEAGDFTSWRSPIRPETTGPGAAAIAQALSLRVLGERNGRVRGGAPIRSPG